ncbi:MAG: serine hydrolase domain-containing protein, partial [Bacteroidales bacterium]
MSSKPGVSHIFLIWLLFILAGFAVLGLRISANSREVELVEAPTPPPTPINHLLSNRLSDLEETRRMEKTIDLFLRQNEIRGASLAIMKDGKLVYSKGFGYADAEDSIPADVQHIFRIASVSKLITATGIMKLCEEGRLPLNRKVFGPEGILNDSLFCNFKDKRYHSVTVEHLLRHQGGFSLRRGDPMFSTLDIARRMRVSLPLSLEAVVANELSYPLGYTPGQGTSYSNLGYAILSLVIEKVSGKEYESYIREEVLAPAGCFDMHLGHNRKEQRFANEVAYYETAKSEMVPAVDGSGQLVEKCNGGSDIHGLYGAGAWVASPTELLLFVAAIDGDPTIPDILRPETIRLMTTDLDNSLPIGWMQTHSNGIWKRTGTLSGTSAIIKRQP